MAVPAAVTNQVNACATKISQMSPGANATKNNQLLTAAIADWPNQTRGIGWGPAPWTPAKAAAFCDWMSGLGVNVSALRSYLGV